MSKRRWLVERAAERDLEEVIDYLLQTSPRAARRFVKAAYETLEFLGEFPRSGALCDPLDPRLVGIRWWPVRDLENWLMFYRVFERVQLERVLHGKRNIRAVLSGGPGSSD